MEAGTPHESRPLTIDPQTRWVEQIDVPADTQFVVSVRRRLTDLLRSAGVASGDVNDLAIAVSEAVSNAIEHAKPGDDQPVVRVRCEIDADTICVIVTDRGAVSWDPASVPAEADPLDNLEGVHHHGRGLQFMSALTDDMKIGVGADGTEVRLMKRRHAPGEGRPLN